ncbi:MAG: helix-turn-helix domain-containing protein, partial [Candidatus Dormiibacterota bacterium]
LAVLRILLKAPSTSAEVARALGMAPAESTYHLAALGQAGLVGPDSGVSGGQRFQVLDQSRDWIAELITRGGSLGSRTVADPSRPTEPVSQS